jgi:hypothetical protein
MKRYLFGWSASCVLLSISIAANEQSAIEHGAAANREYKAVFSRSDAPCSEDYSTATYVECMSKELGLIEAHLDALVEELRGVAGSHEELDALNQNDTKWRAYRESASMLPFKRSGTGTIKGPMSVECRWNLDRAYMKQLSDFYILSQFPNRSQSQ